MATEESNSCTLTDYEKLRLENMKRNQAIIEALRIHSAKSEMHLLSGGLRANRGGRHWRKEGLIAVRRSRRLTKANSASEDTLAVDFSIPNTEPAQPMLALEDTKQSLSLASVRIQGSSNDDLIKKLQRIDDNAPLSSLPCMKSLSPGAVIEPSNYFLQKSDTARVVPERITSASFLPLSEHLFLVAGDKLGNLGFWNVESSDPEGNGLHVYRPHMRPVSGIAFPSFHATKVLTCSYDQTVKLLDVQTATFNLMYCSDKDEIVSAICSVPGSPFCVYIAEGPGYLKMLDMREKCHSLSVDAHGMTINTIDLNLHDPWLMVTSSTDTKVRVWDVRKFKNAYSRLSSLSHKKAVQSAQFSPSGKAIATCRFKFLYFVWHPRTVAVDICLQGFSCCQNDMRADVGIHSCDSPQNTFCERVIEGECKFTCFLGLCRAIWGWDDSYVYVGNVKKSIDIISTKFEIGCEWLSSPLMTSVPSRLAVHPSRSGMLAGCSSRGEVYLWCQREVVTA
ncbi:hypothetical protein L7F22_061870 [Adiantum nelumboides]|nr:hypothetical protein [Adiantum nelumboides]